MPRIFEKDGITVDVNLNMQTARVEVVAGADIVTLGKFVLAYAGTEAEKIGGPTGIVAETIISALEKELKSFAPFASASIQSTPTPTPSPVTGSAPSASDLIRASIQSTPTPTPSPVTGSAPSASDLIPR